MNIQNISKRDGEVIVRLSVPELIKLCNALYAADDGEKNELYYRLYSEMMITRDICQYGHIDDFYFGCIAKCRELAARQMEEE